ncbi:unnamed protein product [Rhizophagus irregularis]|uniref:Bromo domain-containing protein n=1 Tax=Rhizophagus irregularis TaxID=588596 RepID=A0A915ZH59_9GLOM|nr:unnamed protein product [Rhizophagus irregularis]CAB5376949.1 unnamed protein product [Rhizophagus irregularis]
MQLLQKVKLIYSVMTYDILCELKNTIFYQPFCTYTENLNSDYFKKINYPMDLFIVNSKLENNQYSNEKEFENDVCLIFNNYCSIYDIGSEMYHLGRSLECIFNEKFKKFKNQTKQEQRSRKQDNDDNMNDLSIDKLYFY